MSVLQEVTYGTRTKKICSIKRLCKSPRKTNYISVGNEMCTASSLNTADVAMFEISCSQALEIYKFSLFIYLFIVFLFLQSKGNCNGLGLIVLLVSKL